MKRVALETIGCRLNQYETERLAGQLAKLGLTRVDFEDAADLYIVNTCTVTGRADASCRRAIIRAGKNERAKVVVIGCYVTADPDKVATLNGVDLVINNEEKERTPQLLQQYFPDLFNDPYHSLETPPISDFHRHNRAWVKIGDGCNQNCSYCIVPMVRGGIVNRAPDEIIAEINNLILSGYKEVVLTGVHLGRYSYDKVASLADLVEQILERTSLARLRLSSIEPQEITENLGRTISGAGDRICRHLHIPLQSGSDRILNLMHRPYTVRKYLEAAEEMKRRIPGLIIGADIIVGFPGETDDDFEKSVATASSGLIDYLHVFSYSDRLGTEASRLKEKIHSSIIKKRNEVLHRVSRDIHRRALEREIGHWHGAISEHRAPNDKLSFGITDNFLKIQMPANSNCGKDIIKLQVTGVVDDYMVGRPE
ncbi:putative Threonylcarbamoyladenosine tRNA methylthiotransferase MtaB [Candidatus Zixiibacteriota bacterium]|nr:putative Threonylcarbamoyladenosine tRNA methylthiotransferase MtaB [candidate division Zixibacteria bacterium]